MTWNQTLNGTAACNSTSTGIDNCETGSGIPVEDILQEDPSGMWVVRRVRMSNLISEKCYRRVFNEEVTAADYIGVMSCVSDKLKMPLSNVHFHKEQLGLLAVFCDILSLVLMYYLFGKLKSINAEYLKILDNNVIRMKDFTIQVKRLQVDHQTQDMRILKLKMWLHFTELLKGFREGENQMEVVDV
jgi:hypothetical protein